MILFGKEDLNLVFFIIVMIDGHFAKPAGFPCNTLFLYVSLNLCCYRTTYISTYIQKDIDKQQTLVMLDFVKFLCI